MTARVGKRGGIRYYYGQGKIPLGGCPHKAMHRWAELEAGRGRDDDDQLLDHSELLERAVPLKPVAGVYFLIAGGVIRYVGQTRNLFKRIEEHRLKRVFDSYAVLPCAPEEAPVLEARYIDALKPEWNIALLGSEIRNKPQEMPLSVGS
jgi:hypothetical protein